MSVLLFNMLIQNYFMKIEAVGGYKGIARLQQDKLKMEMPKINPSTGCILYKVKDQNGEQHVYTVNQFKYDEKQSRTKLTKLLLTALWIISAAFNIAAMLVVSEVNGHILVNILDIIAMLIMLYLAYTLINQLKARNNMTVYQFMVGVVGFKKAALLTSVPLLLSFILMVIYSVIGGYTSSADIMTVAFQLVSVAAVIVMFVVEMRRKIIAMESN